MSKKFIYTRKFLILKGDFINIPNTRPKGHGLIEARENIGKININVDMAEKENNYNVYLVGLDNGEIVEVDLGGIVTNNRGKGKLEGTFNPRNIEGSNYSIDKFNALVIRRGINILLTGYINKDDGVLDQHISSLEIKKEGKQEKKEIKTKIEVKDKDESEIKVLKRDEDEKKIEEIAPKVEELEEPIENKKEPKDEKKIELGTQKEEIEIEEIEEKKEIEFEDKYKAETKTEKEEVPIIDEINYNEPEEKIEEEIIEELNYKKLEEELEVESTYDQKDIDYMKRMDYKKQTSEYVLSILRFFPYVNPFRIELKGYDWWEIQYDGENIRRGFLPFYNFLFNNYNNYPFMQEVVTCHELIKKYGHYLFGMYRDEKEIKYYIYGIPGRFDSLEHPFKGVTGLNTWYEAEDGFGYWIMYIDPLMGKVIYPLNPMIPPY